MRCVRGHSVISGREIDIEARALLANLRRYETEFKPEDIYQFDEDLGEALVEEHEEKRKKLEELSVRREYIMSELSHIEDSIEHTRRALDDAEERLIAWHNHGIIKLRAIFGDDYEALERFGLGYLCEVPPRRMVPRFRTSIP